MAGHLSPIKGQDVFLRAAAIVSNQRDDVDFVIAGEDKSRSGENRVQIEQLTTELGLADRVHSLGWVHDLRDFYNSLDVFVSPSRIEPFGLVILEAMACRIPVIATASEGATEIIEQGMTGRLVPVEDHHALADEILNLLDSDPERKRLSHNAFVVTKDRFSLASMVDATENVYADILKERRA
jgi:glycosyltransferase involved in cell wall biosynthesis